MSAFTDHSDDELRKMLLRAISQAQVASARQEGIIAELRSRAVLALTRGDIVVGDGFDACHRFKEPVESTIPGEFRGLCGRKGVVGVTPRAERRYAYECRACEKKYLAPSPTPGERA